MCIRDRLLTQLATARGATVITTVSTAEKEELSRAAGAAEGIRYDQFDDLTAQLPQRVRALSDGGVQVVYDGVGRTTFDASLACLRRRGLMVLFGASSGPVEPFDLQRLNAGGSLYVTRPTLGHYIVTREELQGRAAELFAAIDVYKRQGVSRNARRYSTATMTRRLRYPVSSARYSRQPPSICLLYTSRCV